MGPGEAPTQQETALGVAALPRDDALGQCLRLLARDSFGHDALRPEQERVMRALMQGQDALAILPTVSVPNNVRADSKLPRMTLKVTTPAIPMATPIGI